MQNIAREVVQGTIGTELRASGATASQSWWTSAGISDMSHTALVAVQDVVNSMTGKVSDVTVTSPSGAPLSIAERLGSATESLGWQALTTGLRYARS